MSPLDCCHRGNILFYLSVTAINSHPPSPSIWIISKISIPFSGILSQSVTAVSFIPMSVDPMVSSTMLRFLCEHISSFMPCVTKARHLLHVAAVKHGARESDTEERLHLQRIRPHKEANWRRMCRCLTTQTLLHLTTTTRSEVERDAQHTTRPSTRPASSGVPPARTKQHLGQDRHVPRYVEVEGWNMLCVMLIIGMAISWLHVKRPGPEHPLVVALLLQPTRFLSVESGPSGHKLCFFIQ